MKSTQRGYSHKLIGVGILSSVLGLGPLAFGQDRGTDQATGPPEYDLSWFTVDGGGVMVSAGDDYELSGTIGQPDAGGMAGGEFQLTGGFWFETPPGDCDADGLTNLTEYAAFEGCLAGPADPIPPGCACYDANRDGQIDLKDNAVFQAAFNASD